MRKATIFLFALSILMTACNLPQRGTPISENEVATVVAATFSAMPSSTSRPVTPTRRPDNTTTPTTASGLPTAILSPTPTVTPTITSTPEDPKITLGPADMQASFNGNNNGFYDEDDEYASIYVEDGALVLVSLQAVGWYSWSLHYHKLKDFYIEAAIRTQTCASTDVFGLVFRSPDVNSGYFYGFTCDGKYFLKVFDGDQTKMLIEPIFSEKILAGSNQNNLIGIMAKDNHLTLYANNQKLLELDDSTFNQGTFGVFISSGSTHHFTIGVEDYSYWSID